MAKIVYMSDIHLRPSIPLYRKENYTEQQFDKFNFMIETANELNAPIVVGGDLLDRSSNHPTRFLNRVMNAMRKLHSPWYIVPGNHDLLGHNMDVLEENTIYTMDFWEGMKLIRESCVLIFEDDVYLYLTPFGMEPILPEVGKKNILVVHEPVFESAVPFYMPDAFNRHTLKKRFPGYDLYFAGDIHIPFAKDNVYVAGSMMRMTTAQKDQRPRFYIIDTQTMEVETVYFPIEEDVWKLQTEVETSEVFKTDLSDIVDAINERGLRISYSAACQQLAGRHAKAFDVLIQEYKTKKGA